LTNAPAARAGTVVGGPPSGRVVVVVGTVAPLVPAVVEEAKVVGNSVESDVVDTDVEGATVRSSDSPPEHAARHRAPTRDAPMCARMAIIEQSDALIFVSLPIAGS